MPVLADVLAQALNGLAYGVLLFLLSVGLTLIFGMLDVVNLAHGSLLHAGRVRGAHPHRRAPATSGSPCSRRRSSWASSARSSSASCLRPLYRRSPLDQVLLTFGLIYLFEDLVKWIWGGRIRSIPPPELFSGSVTVWRASPSRPTGSSSSSSGSLMAVAALAR